MDENKVKEIVGGLKEEIIQVIQPEVVEKVFNKLQDSLPERKNIFGGDDNAKAEREKAEKATEYIRAKAVGDDAKAKALSAGSSTNGAELVPTELTDTIIYQAEKHGLVRKNAQVMEIGANTDIPTMGSVSAYRSAEGVKVDSSQPTTGAINLRTKTVGVLVPFSKKLLRNATPSIMQALVFLAGRAVAKLEDQWGLLGLSAGEGVFQNTNVTGVTLGSGETDYTDLDPDDLLDMLNIAENYYDEKLRWTLSLSMLNVLRKIRAAVGTDKQGFLFQGIGESTPSTIFDVPYDLSPVMPKVTDVSQAGKKFIALVNWANVILGQEQGFTMEISDQATITDTNGSTLINLFEQNMVAVKFTIEEDIQLANATEAFAWLKTAAS